ncbi:adenine-specific DNA-methyltransferase [Pseudomonas delhiensis]|uniref:site-specific DNA-methyltransferase (adenine-specific) n=1 Tax=Pseudomonas delhiensis TaxID=366289 RepID=A0A239N516_9PSED|nr:DNA methyltransferase [Pseudomonas delhiensis]SDK88556.1 adenine-specific DNA-methyltransferase [Pseudomonas delhiensis]SNT49563.1 adenine-specific DNA-methyltransferase [Pseudomonas delhiensis]
MSDIRNPKHQALVAKLREIFQIDRPELDFGVYRILNARAGEINDYLDRRLPRKIREHLAGDGEHENAVFSHLLTFFGRYYNNGDFVSQRRYKGDTYAIPYAGEEVMLHWANKDQYYTKSGENFANYSFRLEDGRTVHFRLVAADTAKDNRKDNDKERRFALIEPMTVSRTDEHGHEYDEALRPIEESDGADGQPLLTLRFEYRPVAKGTRQETLIGKAVETVLGDAAVQARWAELARREPTEKNPQRTLLEKNLTDYTSKNTADYFIHKDLARFLRGELDFYIKNEVLHLDDLQNATAIADIEKSLRMTQCLRAIAQELIDFLAQLEEFQKKLWLKKKFVVSSHYCITLDRVPEALYPAIAANPRQWEQWRQLGLWTGAANGTEQDLRNAPFRMLDTSLYDAAFKARLLASLSDLDGSVDGIFVHSDNFQALSFLQERYREQVKYIYIDPPYNTNSTPILYKNEYKHSSWMSLMQDRLVKGMGLLRYDGVKTVAIDDSEMVNLSKVMEQVAPEHTLSRVTVVHNPKGSITRNFNRTHEYALFLTRDGLSSIARTLEENDTPRKMRRWGENSRRIDRRPSFYPIYVLDGRVVDVGTVPDDDFHPAGRNVLLADGRVEVWPIDQDGVERRWNFGLDSIRQNLERIAARKVGDDWDLFVTHEQTVPKTVWSGGEFDAGKYGNSLLIDMLGEKRFDFPKSIHLVKKCISLAVQADEQALVLDYFGGSGTTAHAVIELRREARAAGLEPRLGFILVEQGEYFESVTKPRAIKAIYSAQWKDGEPTAPQTGLSGCFKVLKLESYEDALNNIQLARPPAVGDLFGFLPDHARDDYLLRYMLNVESRASLLSIGDFRKPFDYAMDIAVDSAGAFERRPVDLVETFNYLLGLRVGQVDAQLERGFVKVTGTLPGGERCLVLWRDCEVLDYEGVSRLCEELAIDPADSRFDVIYLNGDHNIPAVLTQTAAEGGATRELRLRQIEPEFLERMFAVEAL